jgi:flagellin
MAYKNSQDAVSLIQTAEGSLSEIDNMAQRVRELTVQAANDTNTGGNASDRSKIADEVDQLLEEITNMAGRTEFNTKVLTTGNYQIGSTATIQGADAGLTVKTANVSDATTNANGDAATFNGGNAISFDDGDNFFVFAGDGSVKSVSQEDLGKLGAGVGDTTVLGKGKTASVVTANDVQKDDDGYMYIKGTNGKNYYLTDATTVVEKKDSEVEKMTAKDKNDAGYILDNSSLTFQIGANNRSDDALNARQSITMNLSDVTADSLFGAVEYDTTTSTASLKTAKELTSDVLRADDSSADDIAGVLDVIDAGIDIVSAQRSKLGAVQNRLEYTASNLQVSSENLNAANSRIEDADMATEMSNLTSANVLQQAATAMLSQANSSTQTVLQLLQ